MGKVASKFLKKLFRNVLNFESTSWLFKTESQFSLLRCVINSIIVSLFISQNTKYGVCVLLMNTDNSSVLFESPLMF
jgi:hypothetical protein